MFVGSVGVIALFVGIGVVAPKRAEAIFSGMQSAILSGFRLALLLAVAIFLFSMLFLGVQPLRRAEARAGRFRNPIQVPVLDRHVVRRRHGHWPHVFCRRRADDAFLASPQEARTDDDRSQREAMSVTFFIGGVHAWAIYSSSAVTRLFRIRGTTYPDRPIRPSTAPQGGYSRADRTCRDISRSAGQCSGSATSLDSESFNKLGLNYLLGVPPVDLRPAPARDRGHGNSDGLVVSGVEKGVAFSARPICSWQ